MEKLLEPYAARGLVALHLAPGFLHLLIPSWPW